MNDVKQIEFLIRQKEGELREALKCARNGDPSTEEELEKVYLEFKNLCYDLLRSLPKNDAVYHACISWKDRWQECVMELICENRNNRRRELEYLKSQLADTMATVRQLHQLLEESNDRNSETFSNLHSSNTLITYLAEKRAEDNEKMKTMTNKQEVLLAVIKDQVKKQERLTEDNARVKQQLEESKDNNKKIGERLQDLERMNKELAAKQERLTEDNERMKQQLEESDFSNRESSDVDETARGKARESV